MNKERAHALAAYVARVPGYGVLEVRRAWSAAVARQVEAEDRRTGERLLLLSEDQFDRRLMMEAGHPDTGEITIAQPITAQPALAVERAATHHSSPRAQAHAINVRPGP